MTSPPKQLFSDSLASRKRKIDSILRHKTRMLRDNFELPDAGPSDLDGKENQRNENILIYNDTSYTTLVGAYSLPSSGNISSDVIEDLEVTEASNAPFSHKILTVAIDTASTSGQLDNSTPGTNNAEADDTTVSRNKITDGIDKIFTSGQLDNSMLATESFIAEAAETGVLREFGVEVVEPVTLHQLDDSALHVLSSGPYINSPSHTSSPTNTILAMPTISSYGNEPASEIAISLENPVQTPGDVKESSTQDSSFHLAPGHSSWYVSMPKVNNSVDTEFSTTNKRSCKKRIPKSYADFLSDNDDFSSGSSNLWSPNESDNSKCSSPIKKCKKTKNKTRNHLELSHSINMRLKKPNKGTLRKKCKDAGLSYETKLGQVREERDLKKNPCLPNKCFKKCYEISEDRRKGLFEHFWNLDVQRRRDWIVRCVQPCNIKRKKTKFIESRRSLTYEYYINEGEGSRQVCQQFLLRTLDITQKFILYTIQHSIEGMASQEKRTCNAPKYSEEVKKYVHSFINALPAVPSHYCRKKSSCLYLPQEYRNVTNLYRIYLKNCKENSKNNVSEKVFVGIFKNDYNIRFHMPKKDKCVLCTKTENKENILTEDEIKEIAIHLEEKKASYQRFNTHQNLISKDTLTVSFDLQKVLNTPYGESMLLYYSRKYAFYNCTFYESQTKIGHCFLWGESDGKRGGNDIATCVYKFLLEIDKRSIKNVLLYCDSCPGQNKNKILLTAIHHFLTVSNNIQVVQINYLLPGHTYMPVDSMHAVIERETKRIIVWAPSQWPTYIESARKRPKPYQINVLEHFDFINWDNLVSKTFTDITQKQLHLKKMRIVTLKKHKENIVEVKYSMKEDERPQIIALAEQRKRKFSSGKVKGKKSKIRKGKEEEAIPEAVENQDPKNIILPILYENRLPISVAKYNDLKKLCNNGIIPKRFHKEYLELPSMASVRDALPETDVEEAKDEE